MKKIIALLLAVVFVSMPLAACNDGAGNETEENKYKASDVVLKSENFSFTRAEFSIVFHQYFMDFFYDSEVVDFYNVDLEASLKDQVYYDDVTWFSYFADMAVDYMTTMLTLCEAAKDDGMELSEDEIAEIEKAVDTYVRYAADYGYSEDEYFTNLFGKDADQDALREYYKKEALAYKYQMKEMDSYSFTDEEMMAYAEENRESFMTIDYISYTFDEDKDKNAKAAADSLAKITDPSAFDSYLITYMTDTLMLKQEEITTKDCYNKCKYYDEYSEFSKWAFGEGAAAGTTYVKANEVDGQYTVYLLTKAAGLRTEPTKDVRTITVSIDSHETTAKAQSYAEELLKKWQDGEATEESFIELVKSESDSETEIANDGLTKGVAIGDDVPEGLCDWLYDSATVPGSADVFKATGCYYVVYFCGDGEIKWKMDAESVLVNEKLTEKEEALAEQYPVEKFDKVINSLEK